MTRTKSICFFVGALNAGGAERVLVWVAENLVRDGADVTIVTLDDGKADRIPVGPDIRRISLDLKASNSLLKKPIANIKRVVRLRQVIKDCGVDTLVAFMPQEAVMAILASFGMRHRVVISERNAPWRRALQKPWDFLCRRLYRFANVQVAQTQTIGDWLEKTASCGNVMIIPNAVQSSLAANLPQLAPSSVVDGSHPLVLAIGTKPAQKGFDLLLAAFSRLADAFPDWQLAILGLATDKVEAGVSTADLLEGVARQGLSDRVFFPGPVGNVSDWYKACDLFVLSSRFEGFPNVLIEAMSFGCACVAFDCETGPGDIIVDGENGLLVSEQDAEALALAMTQAMADVDLRTRFSQAAPDVLDTFSPEKVMMLWRKAIGFEPMDENERK